MSSFFRDDRGSHQRDLHQPHRPADLMTEPTVLSSLLSYCSVCDKDLNIFHRYEHLLSKEHAKALRERGGEIDASELVSTSDTLAVSPTFNQSGFSRTSNFVSLHSFLEMQVPRYVSEQPANHDTPQYTSSRTQTSRYTPEPAPQERYTPGLDSRERYPPEPSTIYNTPQQTPSRAQTPRYTPESPLRRYIPEIPANYDTPQHTPFKSQIPRYSPEPAIGTRYSPEPPFTPTYTETASPIDHEPQTFLCGICNAPIPISAVTSHLTNSATWKCSKCEYSVHADWKEQHLGACVKTDGECKVDNYWLQESMQFAAPSDGERSDIEGGIDLLGGDDVLELTGWGVMNFQHPTPGPREGGVQTEYSSTTTSGTEDGGVQVKLSPRINESEFGSESGDTEYTDAIDTQPWDPTCSEEWVTTTPEIDISALELGLGYQDSQSLARGSSLSPPETIHYFPLVEVESYTPQVPTEHLEIPNVDVFFMQEMDLGIPLATELSQKSSSPTVDITSKVPASPSTPSINQDKLPQQPGVHDPSLTLSQLLGFNDPTPSSDHSVKKTSEPPAGPSTRSSHQLQSPQEPDIYEPPQILSQVLEIHDPEPEPSQPQESSHPVLEPFQLPILYDSSQTLSPLLGIYDPTPQPPTSTASITPEIPANPSTPPNNQGQLPQQPEVYDLPVPQPSAEHTIAHQSSPPHVQHIWGARALPAPQAGNTEWTCNLCKRSMQYESRMPHLMGSKHRIQVELDRQEQLRKRALPRPPPRAPPKPPISKFSWECELCNRVMDKATQRSHLAGSKHKLQMELKKREGPRSTVISEAARRAEEMKRFDELQRAGELRRAEELRKQKEVQRLRELGVQEGFQAQERWKQEKERQQQQEIRQQELKRDEEVRRQQTLVQEEELRKQEIRDREYKLSQEEQRRQIEVERRQEEARRRVEEWRREDQRQEELRRQEEQQKAEAFRVQLEKRNEEYRKQEELRRQVPLNLSINNANWKCNDCKKTMSINSRESHLGGKKHRAQLELLNATILQSTANRWAIDREQASRMQEDERRKEDERRREEMKRHEEKRKEENARALEEKEKERHDHLAGNKNWRRELQQPTATSWDIPEFAEPQWGCGVCKKRFAIGLRDEHLTGSAHQERLREVTEQGSEIKTEVASNEICKNDENKVRPKMRLQLWLSSKVREAEVTVVPPPVEHDLYTKEAIATMSPPKVKPNLNINGFRRYSVYKREIDLAKGGVQVGAEHQKQIVDNHATSGGEAGYRDIQIVSPILSREGPRKLTSALQAGLHAVPPAGPGVFCEYSVSEKITSQSKPNSRPAHSIYQAHSQPPVPRILEKEAPSPVNKMLTQASDTTFFCECGKRVRRKPWCRDCDYSVYSSWGRVRNNELRHQRDMTLRRPEPQVEWCLVSKRDNR